jgi:hypothetical protein
VTYQAGWQAMRKLSLDTSRHALPPRESRACQPFIHGRDEFPGPGWQVESEAAIRLCATWCPVVEHAALAN